MRAVLQRVSQAQVVVDGKEIGSIGPGWLVFVGVGPGDSSAAAALLVDKIAKLRAFEDDAGKMNRSAEDVGAELLVVSQFTLYADLTRGRRPSFMGAASPEQAEPLVEQVVQLLRRRGLRVASGRFVGLTKKKAAHCLTGQAMGSLDHRGDGSLLAGAEPHLEPNC